MEIKSINIACADNFRLSATLFRPEQIRGACNDRAGNRYKKTIL